jgi:hypothetical protein
VWLRTDAFVEYLQLFKLARFFHIAEYSRLHSEGYGGTYTDFLAEYYSDNFLVRLVVCPVCLSFWLGFFTTPWLGIYGFIVSPLILFFYLIFNKLL